MGISGNSSIFFTREDNQMSQTLVQLAKSGYYRQMTQPELLAAGQPIANPRKKKFSMSMRQQKEFSELMGQGIAKSRSAEIMPEKYSGPDNRSSETWVREWNKLNGGRNAASN